MGVPATALQTTGPDIDELIRDGDHRAAVAALAREHGRALSRLCMALLASTADAEEAVQDTLLAAYRGMGGYRGDGSLRAWLFGIARRQCAHRLELRGRRAELSLTAEEGDGRINDELPSRLRARQIRKALAQLRPSEREAVVLRYLVGLDYDEIGVALGTAPAAARKRVSRALAALRSLLKES